MNAGVATKVRGASVPAEDTTMSAGDKFLLTVAVLFSIVIVYRVAPGTAIVELITLLGLVHWACRPGSRRDD